MPIEKRITIWLNEKTGSLLILLTKDGIGLSDGNVVYRGRVFKPKEEVHITVVGSELGQKLIEMCSANHEIKERILRAITEVDCFYRAQDEMYHVAKDKQLTSADGESELLHAESIIRMVSVPGIQQFYKQLSTIAGIQLEMPPLHVTLYTYGDSRGIGLSNQAAFREFVTKEVQPNELKRLSPLYLDDILRSLPEVKAGRGLWQNEHHEFDVYDHTLEFVKYVRELTDDTHIIAAGYLHDIGKPVVAKPKVDGVVQDPRTGQSYHTFDDHDRVGENMVREMDPRLFEGLDLDQGRVASLVGCHYLPMKGVKDLRETANYGEFLYAYQMLQQTLEESSVPKEDILIMFLADKLAQGEGCTDREELFAIRNALLGYETDLKKIYHMQKEVRANRQ
jgi:hypothetical protein